MTEGSPIVVSRRIWYWSVVLLTSVIVLVATLWGLKAFRHKRNAQKQTVETKKSGQGMKLSSAAEAEIRRAIEKQGQGATYQLVGGEIVINQEQSHDMPSSQTKRDSSEIHFSLICHWSDHGLTSYQYRFNRQTKSIEGPIAKVGGPVLDPTDLREIKQTVAELVRNQ